MLFRSDPRTAPVSWGELLRIRGALNDLSGRAPAAHHDLSQSVNVFELVGERYQAALSQLALGTLSLRMGATTRARHALESAREIFKTLGARRDLAATTDALDALAHAPSAVVATTLAEADDVVVRRLIDASRSEEHTSELQSH